MSVPPRPHAPSNVPQWRRISLVPELLPQSAREARSEQQALNQEDILVEVAGNKRRLTCCKRNGCTHTIADAVARQSHKRQRRPQTLRSGAVAVECGGVERSLRGPRVEVQTFDGIQKGEGGCRTSLNCRPSR